MITIKRLEQLGWVKKEIYYPGSSKEYGTEYMYHKQSKRLRVNEKNGEIFSYDGHPTSLIKTEDELAEYEKR